MKDCSEIRGLFVRPAKYLVRIAGVLDSTWYDYIGEMAVSTIDGPPCGRSTVLVGYLNDQAALMGILQNFYDSGIPIVGVEVLDDKSSGNGEGF